MTALVKEQFAVSVDLKKAAGDDGDQREVLGIAMVADELDGEKHVFLKSAVKMAAENFLIGYNVSKDIGKDHDSEAPPDIDLIGSMFFEDATTIDGLEVPPNAWVVKLRVNDDELWASVKRGERTGLSIEGEAWRKA